MNSSTTKRMKWFGCIALACLLYPAASWTAPTNNKDFGWMTQYVGKSSSDLASDTRFKPTLSAWLPTQPPLAHTNNTADAAQDFMAQGQGPIQISGTNLFAIGCLPQACGSAGGWLWVDTGPQHAIVLALLSVRPGPPSSVLPLTLVVVGQKLTPQLDLSQAAQQSLSAWLKNINANNVVDCNIVNFEIETPAGKRKAELPSYLRM